jgi:hypothetical protein
MGTVCLLHHPSMQVLAAAAPAAIHTSACATVVWLPVCCQAFEARLLLLLTMGSRGSSCPLGAAWQLHPWTQPCLRGSSSNKPFTTARHGFGVFLPQSRWSAACKRACRCGKAHTNGVTRTETPEPKAAWLGRTKPRGSPKPPA